MVMYVLAGTKLVSLWGCGGGWHVWVYACAECRAFGPGVGSA